jgi:hypothetical protein
MPLVLGRCIGCLGQSALLNLLTERPPLCVFLRCFRQTMLRQTPPWMCGRTTGRQQAVPPRACSGAHGPHQVPLTLLLLLLLLLSCRLFTAYCAADQRCVA